MTSVNALGDALRAHLIASLDELRRSVDDAPDLETRCVRTRLYCEAAIKAVDVLYAGR